MIKRNDQKSKSTFFSVLGDEGMCVDENGSNLWNQGPNYLMPGILMSWEKCIELCSAESDAKACEWSTNSCAYYNSESFGTDGEEGNRRYKIERGNAYS